MLLFIFILILILIAVLFKVYYDNSQYWKIRGIVGPPPSSIFTGNLYDVSRIYYPVVLQLRDWTKKYGSVYGFFEGFKKVLVISDPDMLQELFIKKFDCFYGRKLMSLSPDIDNDPHIHVFDARGTRWKRLRLLANPAFSTKSLKLVIMYCSFYVFNTVDDSAREMVNLMEKYVNATGSINIHEFFQEYTMDVISRIAMGQKESMQFKNNYIHTVLKFFTFNLHNPWHYSAYVFPILRQPIRTFLYYVGKFWNGVLPQFELIERVDKAVSARIKERELLGDDINNEEAKDAIDMFLDAEVEDTHDEQGFDKSSLNISKHLTKDEVVAQCIIFLLAGFDTTANSLAYVSYELSKHQHVVKKIQEELDQVCGNEEINYDHLSRLNYMDCVVKESLRMYPLAAFAASRVCSVSTTLGNIPIQEGVRIMADVWTIHYDEKLWGDDAAQFKPERWESSSRRHVMSWFPFGAGPRQCVGMRLALMEEKLALAHILRRYDIVSGPNTEEKLNLVGSLTTSPEAVNVYLRERTFD